MPIGQSKIKGKVGALAKNSTWNETNNHKNVDRLQQLFQENLSR